MTGYGNASFENDQFSIEVEIKTLNSKFLDVASKLPKEVLQYENEIKKILTEQLVRGKVGFSMELSSKSSNTSDSVINQTLFNHYKAQLNLVSNQVAEADLLKIIMTMPEVLETPKTESLSLDQSTIIDVVKAAVAECDKFRTQEGSAATVALTASAHEIGERLEAIVLKDPERIANIKTRINGRLEEVAASEKADKNRFEQELIYYIEKLDITEEIIRLRNHLVYFNETRALPDSHGKKLGFICQEMGREINTIGSKANNSDIQRLVVDMKDELEKIKEQVLNVV